MEPIIKLARSILEGNVEARDKILEAINIKLTQEEKNF